MTESAKTYSYTITPNAINLLFKNRMRTINKTHVNFSALYDALRNNAPDDIVGDLIDIPSFIAKVTLGRIKVGDTAVLCDGKPINGFYVNQLMTLLSEGFDVAPMVNYLDKREQNPTFTAKEELDLFLQSGNFVLAPDGDFYAFKAVQHDYYSYHTGKNGKVFHGIGTKPSMPREEVDAHRYNLCSSGLHFCSYPYLSTYAGYEGRVLILKINPADVVAIPSDYHNSKGRAWTYEVVGEVPYEEASVFFSGRPPVVTEGEIAGPRAIEEIESLDTSFDAEDEIIVEEEDDDDFDDWTESDFSDFNDDDNDESDVVEFNVTLEESEDGTAVLSFERKDDLSFISAKEAEVEELTDTPGSPVIEEDTSVETRSVQFFTTSDGRQFTEAELKALLDEHGQRGTSRLINVPKATLFGWKKRFTD